MAAKEMVALFDESGTPAISFDQRAEWFIGVGVTYEQSDEDVSFSAAKADFGGKDVGEMVNQLLKKDVDFLEELM